MPHPFQSGLAVGLVLVILLGILWAILHDATLASSIAFAIYSIIGAITLVLSVGLVEWITRDKDNDNDDRGWF